MSELTLADLGLVEEETSVLSSQHAQRLAATLGHDFDATRPLSLLWHWAYFNPVVPTAELGTDGHPQRHGALLIEFPRRMWVGGEVIARRPLFGDASYVRRTRLLSHVRKRGSRGDLLLVELEHTILHDGQEVIVERQDVVYRQAGTATPPSKAAVVLSPPLGWREVVVPTSILLFRYSAVTFNSHRIHYDDAYATRVEGYPGLVVHGPLIAMLLAESASRQFGKVLQSFTYRSSNPLFVDQPIYIDGVVHENANPEMATMKAFRADGVIAMTAIATATSLA